LTTNRANTTAYILIPYIALIFFQDLLGAGKGEDFVKSLGNIELQEVTEERARRQFNRSRV